MAIEQILADIRSDRKKRVFIDTDTYNEMDDQFALVYAFDQSESFDILGIGAAGFATDRSGDVFANGMNLSYNEICTVLEKCHLTGKYPVFKGAEKSITENNLQPVDNPASREIIRLAHSADDTLYILGLGVTTNITSAILMDPSIASKICVISLMTHTASYGNLWEFNYKMDIRSGQMLLNSGVNLVLMPACGLDHEGLGTMWLRMYRSDLDTIKGDSDACKFFRDELPAKFEQNCTRNGEWGRIMWDIAAPGILVHPERFDVELLPAPIITDAELLAFDCTRHKIIYMHRIINPDAFIKETMEIIEKF